MAGAQGTEDKPLELPKYTVTSERGLPPPELWHYARIEGFEILSSARERATRKLAGDFQNFAHAVDLVWPGLRQANGVSAGLIICGQSLQFETFLPGTARPREQVTVSYHAEERAAIVLDVQNRLLNRRTEDAASPAPVTEADAAPAASANVGLTVDTYQQLYREYIRFVLARQRTPPPPWLAEGVAQLLMNLHLTDTEISVGRVEDPAAADGENASGNAFNAALAKRGLLPIGEMLAAHREGDTEPSQLDQIWTKQCYAFVHWGLYGDFGKHQKEFFSFLQRLNREPLTEAMFKECFRQDYAQMLQSLRIHIESTRFKFAGVRADKGTKIPWPPAVELRDATQAEVGRLQGNALYLAGRPAEARDALLTAYLRGERDPALLAALGVAEANGGDVAKARKLLEAAATAHVVQPRASVELARLRLAEARAHPETGERISIRQTAAVLDPLFIARSQPPSLPEVYELVAETWNASAASPNPGQLAVLDEGVRLDVRNAPLVYADAALKAKIGQTAEAESLIRLGLRVTTDVGLRAKFESLQASLPPTVTAAPAK